ncbi:hypothetical protein [Sphaerospermopsis reniformis]|nr:hypothetical protein [Sphaerospermopsis reniformis]
MKTPWLTRGELGWGKIFDTPQETFPTTSYTNVHKEKISEW